MHVVQLFFTSQMVHFVKRRPNPVRLSVVLAMFRGRARLMLLSAANLPEINTFLLATYVHIRRMHCKTGCFLPASYLAES